MRERWATVLRWVVVGLAFAVLARQASGGCGSTLVEPGQAAPAFQAADVRGGPGWSLESFRGRPVALVFSATWCPSCRAEMPHVARVAAAQHGLGVLLVSDEEPVVVARYLGDRGLAIPAAARGGAAWQAYGVRSVPSAVVVGADGTVAWAGQGPAAVGRALKEASELAAAGAAGPAGSRAR